MSNSTTANALAEKRSWVGRFRSHLPGGRSNPARQPQAVPATTYTFREDEGSSTQASDLDLLMGVGENVHRDIKVGLVKLGESKDKGFTDDVVTRVAAVSQDLEAVQNHTYHLGDAIPAPIKASQAKLLQLNADLEREEKYYGDKANVTTGNKGQQRNVKADAIGERRKALDRLMTGKLGPNWKKSIAFQATLDMVDTGSVAEITKLVADKVKDDTSMTELLDGVLEQQLAKELANGSVLKTGDDLKTAQGSLLRLDTGATKVIKAFLLQDKEAQDYLNKCDADMGEFSATIGKKTDLKPSNLKFNNFKLRHPEIKNEDALKAAFNGQSIIKNPNDATKSDNDLTKMHLNDNTVTDDIQAELASRVQGYVGVLGRLIDGIMQIPAPKALALVAASVAKQARAKGLTDDNLVAKAIGSFVMLRFIAPKLVTSIQGTPEVQGANKVMSKIILNCANGITAITKESWLQPLQDVLNTRADAMNAWFLEIARQGGAKME